MRAGGCQYGELRYEIAAEPLALYVCHCRECQKQSASAFGLSLRVPSSRLRVTPGFSAVLVARHGRGTFHEVCLLSDLWFAPVASNRRGHGPFRESRIAR